MDEQNNRKNIYLTDKIAPKALCALMVIHGYSWLSMVIHGYPWLSMSFRISQIGPKILTDVKKQRQSKNIFLPHSFAADVESE